MSDCEDCPFGKETKTTFYENGVRTYHICELQDNRPVDLMGYPCKLKGCIEVIRELNSAFGEKGEQKYRNGLELCGKHQ